VPAVISEAKLRKPVFTVEVSIEIRVFLPETLRVFVPVPSEVVNTLDVKDFPAVDEIVTEPEVAPPNEIVGTEFTIILITNEVDAETESVTVIVSVYVPTGTAEVRFRTMEPV
jgi:hypothetical protein